MKKSTHKQKNNSLVRVLSSDDIFEVNGGESCHCWCKQAGYMMQVSNVLECESLCMKAQDKMKHCLVFDKTDTQVTFRYYQTKTVVLDSINLN